VLGLDPGDDADAFLGGAGREEHRLAPDVKKRVERRGAAGARAWRHNAAPEVRERLTVPDEQNNFRTAVKVMDAVSSSIKNKGTAK